MAWLVGLQENLLDGEARLLMQHKGMGPDKKGVVRTGSKCVRAKVNAIKRADLVLVKRRQVHFLKNCRRTLANVVVYGEKLAPLGGCKNSSVAAA